MKTFLVACLAASCLSLPVDAKGTAGVGPVDSRRCDPLTDSACRAALSAYSRAYDRAHPHEAKAEGNHTVLSTEPTEDYCRRWVLRRFVSTSVVPTADQLRILNGRCFALHPGPTVTTNAQLPDQ